MARVYKEFSLYALEQWARSLKILYRSLHANGLRHFRHGCATHITTYYNIVIQKQRSRHKVSDFRIPVGIGVGFSYAFRQRWKMVSVGVGKTDTGVGKPDTGVGKPDAFSNIVNNIVKNKLTSRLTRQLRCLHKAKLYSFAKAIVLVLSFS